MSKFELKLPKMGESVTEGTILNWLVKEGESFSEGDILLEVATDKVDNEIPAPHSGTLTKTLFHAKDVVPVGEVIAYYEAFETESDSKNKTIIPSETKEYHLEVKVDSKPKLVQITSNSNSFSVSNSNTFFSPLIA